MIELSNLSRKGLVSLIEGYDNYIKNDICEDEQNSLNRYPVSINEYMNNEFLLNKSEDQYKLKVINFGEEYTDIFSETSFNIMEVFEKVLDVNNITIPDINREGNEDEARIFGDTYYSMESEVEDIVLDCVKRIYDDYTNNNKNIPEDYTDIYKKSITECINLFHEGMNNSIRG